MANSKKFKSKALVLAEQNTAVLRIQLALLAAEMPGLAKMFDEPRKQLEALLAEQKQS